MNEHFFTKTKNKLHIEKKVKCRFRYKGVSKSFVEIMYSVEAIRAYSIMVSAKNDQFCDPPSPSVRKNEQQ